MIWGSAQIGQCVPLYIPCASPWNTKLLSVLVILSTMSGLWRSARKRTLFSWTRSSPFPAHSTRWNSSILSSEWESQGWGNISMIGTCDGDCKLERCSRVGAVEAGLMEKVFWVKMKVWSLLDRPIWPRAWGLSGIEAVETQRINCILIALRGSSQHLPGRGSPQVWEDSEVQISFLYNHNQI